LREPILMDHRGARVRNRMTHHAGAPYGLFMTRLSCFHDRNPLAIDPFAGMEPEFS
jgi:hypothetical protein